MVKMPRWVICGWRLLPERQHAGSSGGYACSDAVGELTWVRVTEPRLPGPASRHSFVINATEGTFRIRSEQYQHGSSRFIG
jgi:hypothetical protein